MVSGAKEQQPRWKRCVSATDRNLGDALGELYVAKAFPASAKADVLELVGNLRDAFRDDFATLSWMSPSTREKAIAKLSAFQVKIGYPNQWQNYDALAIARRQPRSGARMTSAGSESRSIARAGA